MSAHPQVPSTRARARSDRAGTTRLVSWGSPRSHRRSRFPRRSRHASTPSPTSGPRSSRRSPRSQSRFTGWASRCRLSRRDGAMASIYEHRSTELQTLLTDLDERKQRDLGAQGRRIVDPGGARPRQRGGEGRSGRAPAPRHAPRPDRRDTLRRSRRVLGGGQRGAHPPGRRWPAADGSRTFLGRARRCPRRLCAARGGVPSPAHERASRSDRRCWQCWP